MNVYLGRSRTTNQPGFLIPPSFGTTRTEGTPGTRLWVLWATDRNESEPLREHLGATQEGCANVLTSPFLLSMQLHSPRCIGASVLLRTTRFNVLQKAFLLYRNHRLTRACPSASDNRRTAELHLAPEAVVDSRQEVTAAPHTINVSTSPPSNAITSANYDALPQDRDSRLQKEVIRTAPPVR